MRFAFSIRFPRTRDGKFCVRAAPRRQRFPATLCYKKLPAAPHPDHLHCNPLLRILRLPEPASQPGGINDTSVTSNKTNRSLDRSAGGIQRTRIAVAEAVS
ncbi:hypothetical protein EMIT0111MI5_10185 [Burkholderia sp. IT-111MI5]